MWLDGAGCSEQKLGTADRIAIAALPAFSPHAWGPPRVDLLVALPMNKERRWACGVTNYKYFSLNTAAWCATCPATMNAHALTVNGLPLATPFRIQASSGKFRKNEMVASRTSRKSSTCRAQETASEWAAATAMSWSKLGSAVSKLRANHKARNRKTRSVSFTWPHTWRILHFSGA